MYNATLNELNRVADPILNDTIIFAWSRRFMRHPYFYRWKWTIFNCGFCKKWSWSFKGKQQIYFPLDTCFKETNVKGTLWFLIKNGGLYKNRNYGYTWIPGLFKPLITLYTSFGLTSHLIDFYNKMFIFITREHFLQLCMTFLDVHLK